MDWSRIGEILKEKADKSNKERKYEEGKKRPCLALLIHISYDAKEQLEILRKELKLPDRSSVIEEVLDAIFQSRSSV